jgi:aspartate kinase
MLKYGEICSTKILSHHLHISRFEFEYIDARTFMKTNFKKQNDFSVKYDHNDVEIDFEETSRLIKQKFEGPFREGKIVICSGFIAQDVNTGDDTTLGYDGSDWSAGIIARVLKAVSLCLWKDVDGLMSNDPDVELNAYLIKSSSFNDAISLCEKNGRWPILRKALEVCRDGCIAIYLRPASDVKSLGTKIYG